MINLASVTPTICDLMEVPYPKGASAGPISKVLDAKKRNIGKNHVTKAFLYAPDAIGGFQAAIVALTCATLFAHINQLKLAQWPYAAAVA